MKVLITGGSGFLGINLVRHLLRLGSCELTCIDIAEFSYPERSQVRAMQGDIRDPAAVRDAVEGAEVVVHAAAALPLYSRQDIFATDVTGTANLLEASLQAGVQRFIHISSTAVYGIPDHHPLYEDDRLVGVGPYGEAKIQAEKLCERYRAAGMCVPILRPKSFVGPERLGVFALLYEWAMEGRGFPVIGRGDNRYQLLDVEDLCRVVYLCAVADREAANGTFNVGAAEFGTIREDFQAVLDCAGHGKRIIGLPVWPAVKILKVLELLRLSPLYRWVYETAGRDSFVSIEKVKNRLGFVPQYSNREALIRNYRWYTANLHLFGEAAGVSHRTPWRQGMLGFLKRLF